VGPSSARDRRTLVASQPRALEAASTASALPNLKPCAATLAPTVGEGVVSSARGHESAPVSRRQTPVSPVARQARARASLRAADPTSLDHRDLGHEPHQRHVGRHHLHRHATLARRSSNNAPTNRESRPSGARTQERSGRRCMPTPTRLRGVLRFDAQLWPPLLEKSTYENPLRVRTQRAPQSGF
jgi:hypothetical protein